MAQAAEDASPHATLEDEPSYCSARSGRLNATEPALARRELTRAALIDATERSYVAAVCDFG